MKAVLEFRIADTWIELGRSRIVDSIPGGDGFDVRITAPCHEGIYRTSVRVDGLGPGGTPFIFRDHGPEQDIALAQCAE